MAKIYKTNSTTIGRLDGHTEGEFTDSSFKHVLNITANLLKYKFIRTQDSKIIYNISIPLEAIKSHPLAASQVFAIPSDVVMRHVEPTPEPDNDTLIEPPSAEEKTLTKTDIAYPLPVTALSRPEILVSPNDANPCYFSTLRIFIPSITGDFTTFEYSVYNEVGGAQIDVEVNAPHTLSTELRSWKQFFSTITTTTQQATPSVGDTINVTVNSSDTSLDMIYVEPIVGIVDKTRVKLTNGIGSFSILTSSLESGDTVDVKLNFKYYTGVARFTKTLS
jgi:hypothetical protein